MVSKRKAIQVAHDRVRLVPFGAREYVVNSYVPGVGTYQSFSMDYWRARAAASRQKIHVALVVLGWSEYDADGIAQGWDATMQGSWTNAVKAPPAGYCATKS